MQGAWQDELNAQTHYGRSQMENEGVVNRPFGVNGYQQSQQSKSFARPRQYGGSTIRSNAVVSHIRSEREGSFDAEGAKRYTGHLSFLKSLQRSSATIRLLTIHDEKVVGIVKDCDEMTITLRVPCATETNPDAYQNRVFFKQNLVEFAPVIEGVTFS